MKQVNVLRITRKGTDYGLVIPKGTEGRDIEIGLAQALIAIAKHSEMPTQTLISEIGIWVRQLEEEPVRFGIPATPKKHFVNIVDFKGLQETTNPLAVEQNSAADILNLYVNENHALTTRPRVEKTFSLPIVDDRTVLDVHKLPDDSLLIHLKVDTSYKIQLIKGTDIIEVSDSEGLIDSHKIEIFVHDGKTYLMNGSKYMIITENETVYNVNEVTDVYIPTRYVGRQGVKEEIEPLNLLTNKYKVDYYWDGTESIDNLTVNSIEYTNDYVISEDDVIVYGKTIFKTDGIREFYGVGTFDTTTSKYSKYDLYVKKDNNDPKKIVSIENIDQVIYKDISCFNRFPHNSAYIEIDDNYNNVVVSENKMGIGAKVYVIDYLLNTQQLSSDLPFSDTIPIDNIKMSSDGTMIGLLMTNLGRYVIYRKVNDQYELHTFQYANTNVCELLILNTDYLVSLINGASTREINILKLKDDGSLADNETLYTISNLEFSNITVSPNELSLYILTKSNTLILFDLFRSNGHRDLQYTAKKIISGDSLEDTYFITETSLCSILKYKIVKMKELTNTENITVASIIKNKIIIIKSTLIKTAYSEDKIYAPVVNYPEALYKINDFGGFAGYYKVVDNQYVELITPDDFNNVINNTITVTISNVHSILPLLQATYEIKEEDPEYDDWYKYRQKILTPSFSSRFNNNYILASGDHIFISSYNDPTYFTLEGANKCGTDDLDVTGFNIITDSVMTIYKKDKLYLLSINETVNYVIMESKAQQGNVAINNCIITTLNELPIQIMNTGFYALAQTENVASDEHIAELISNNITSKFVKELNKEKILSINYKYWTLFYLNKHIYVLDNRSLQWFYWELPLHIINWYKKDDELFFADYLGNFYKFTETDIINRLNNDTEYYDDGDKIINWFWESQILNLGTLNYYKQLLSTGFIFVDSDKQDQYGMNYRFKIYREMLSEVGEITIKNDLNYITSITKRTHIPRFNFLQLKISNIEGDYNNNKLYLIGLMLKYKLLEVTR